MANIYNYDTSFSYYIEIVKMQGLFISCTTKTSCLSKIHNMGASSKQVP